MRKVGRGGKWHGEINKIRGFQTLLITAEGLELKMTEEGQIAAAMEGKNWKKKEESIKGGRKEVIRKRMRGANREW